MVTFPFASVGSSGVSLNPRISKLSVSRIEFELSPSLSPPSDTIYVNSVDP